MPELTGGIPRLRNSLMWLLGFALTAGVAWGQPREPYPKDQASRWMPLADVASRLTKGASLEAVSSESVLKSREIPFDEVGLAPTRVSPRPNRTWTVPPFAPIGPPGSPEVTSARSAAPVFAELESDTQAPSQYLRPRRGPNKLQARFSDFRVPEALSRVCFTTANQGMFQLSLYGGGNSFFARDAYVALRATLDRREEVAGAAEESVWGTYKEEPPKPPSGQDGRFDAIPVVGPARPEALDRGLNRAKKAPAFQGVSTELQPQRKVDLSALPVSGPQPAPRAPRNYWVWLGYFPDQALAVELVLDQRLGELQDLLNLATLVQGRITSSANVR